MIEEVPQDINENDEALTRNNLQKQQVEPI